MRGTPIGVERPCLMYRTTRLPHATRGSMFEPLHRIKIDRRTNVDKYRVYPRELRIKRCHTVRDVRIIFTSGYFIILPDQVCRNCKSVARFATVRECRCWLSSAEGRAENLGDAFGDRSGRCVSIKISIPPVDTVFGYSPVRWPLDLSDYLSRHLSFRCHARYATV